MVFSRKGKKLPVLQCKNSIQLLRSAIIVKQWKKIQQKKGYLPFTVQELGLINKHAHIEEITISHINTSESTMPAGMVTGIFSRYVLDTAIYAFLNMKTGVHSSLIVTPNHPFYVKNKQTFIPIDKVSLHDRLVNDSGDKVQLFSADSGNHGKKHSLSSIPVRVYNMELHQKHIYFAGAERIMVHNICTLTHQQVYDYFNREKLFSEKALYQPADMPPHSLSTIQLIVPKKTLWDLNFPEGGSKASSETPSLLVEHILEDLGFSYNTYIVKDGTAYEIWYLKYPVKKDTYEQFILTHMGERQSFDKFMKQKTGQDKICYKDLYRLIEKISPSSACQYGCSCCNYKLSTASMLIKKSDNGEDLLLPEYNSKRWLPWI